MTKFPKIVRHLLTLTATLGVLGFTSNATAGDSVEFPTRCAKSGATSCTPTKKTIKRLCKKKSQEVALRMFKPGTPWKRLHIRNNIETRYSKNRYAKTQLLRTAEEVLVLVDRTKAKGGMTVSGYGNYDVIRFNGHCTTVMAGDLFQFRPTVADYAPMNWKRMKRATRKALLTSKGITWRADRRKDICKSYGKRSLECEGAKLDLSRVVAERLHKGHKIPALKFLP